MNQAFLSSQGAVRLHAWSQRNHKHVCRQRPTWTMCTSEDPQPKPTRATDEMIDDSWRIYSKPGNPCVICFGKGKSRCMYCYGKGIVVIGPEEGRDTIPCPHCKGAMSEICRRCDGTGIRPNYRFVPESDEPVRNLTNEEVCNLPTQAEIELENEKKEAAKAEETEKVEEAEEPDAAEESIVPDAPQ